MAGQLNGPEGSMKLLETSMSRLAAVASSLILSLLSLQVTFAQEAKDELVRQTITYRQVAEQPDGNKKSLIMLVTKPKDWKEGDQRPAILFFHGGGWVGGKPGQFTAHASHFAAQGIVCFQAQYRLLDRKKPNQPPANCVEDAKAAMEFVRSNAKDWGVDPGRIATAGGSAGGHLAAYLGMIAPKELKPQAMLLFNPVYDNGPGGWGTGRVGEQFKLYSPAHNITKDDPPSIVFLGTQDKLIPVSTAEKFQQKCKDLGVASDLRTYEGQGHGFFNEGRDGNRWYKKTVAESDAFLKQLGWID